MTTRTHQFGSVTVRVWHPPERSRVETWFPSGAMLPAEPQDGDDYRDRALSLGYESADAMNREHDPLHSFLADKLGYQWSPCLRAAAHEMPIDRVVADREEACVLAFQRYMNTGVADMDRLLPLVEAGLELATLREESLCLLR